MTDRQTDGQTEFSSLDRVCIVCSAVIKAATQIIFYSCMTLEYPWRKWRWGMHIRAYTQKQYYSSILTVAVSDAAVLLAVYHFLFVGNFIIAFMRIFIHQANMVDNEQ